MGILMLWCHHLQEVIIFSGQAMMCFEPSSIILISVSPWCVVSLRHISALTAEIMARAKMSNFILFQMLFHLLVS
jgi:photosystem II stability/assembly factor-like uncharacterized protein